MKVVNFTVEARLQVVSIITSQPAVAPGTTTYAVIRLDSKILDKIEMSEDDKVAIGLRTVGAKDEVVVWDPKKSADIPLKEVHLEDTEAARLKTVLEAWGMYRHVDLRWIDLLFPQLGISIS